MFLHSCWGCDQFPAIIALAQLLGFCVVIVAVVIASGFGLSYHFYIIDHAFVGYFVLNRHSLYNMYRFYIFKPVNIGRFCAIFLLVANYRMIRALSESQITEVEAVYLCLFDGALTLELKMALIIRIYDVKLQHVRLSLLVSVQMVSNLRDF